VDESIKFPGCQLADDFEDRGWPAGHVGDLFIEPKLDGYRLNAVIDADSVTFYCRGKDPVPWGQNLDHIAEDLLAAGFRNCMIDGEVMALDWNKTGIVRSGCSTKKGVAAYAPPSAERMEEIRTTVKFHVFDWVCLDLGSLVPMKLPGWRTARNVFPLPLAQRREFLESMLSVPGLLGCVYDSLVLTEVALVSSEPGVRAAMDDFVARGYEGAMLKLPTSIYVFDRHSGWLKVKPVKTEEMQVVGWQEGEGKYVGMLGSLHCVKADGTKVSVGTGIDDAQRAALYARRHELGGLILEVKSQESAVAAARHPVFVRWRPDRASL